MSSSTSSERALFVVSLIGGYEPHPVRCLDWPGFRCTVQAVDAQAAARRWAQTWQRAWLSKDVEAIAALYAPGATYRSHPMRDPEPGGPLGYTQREFALEDSIECRFGAPVSAGDRAAVEWWASYVENGRERTLAGATVLRFDAEGLVVDHVDYWVEADG
jgi:SnoaL-like domain